MAPSTSGTLPGRESRYSTSSTPYAYVWKSYKPEAATSSGMLKPHHPSGDRTNRAATPITAQSNFEMISGLSAHSSLLQTDHELGKDQHRNGLNAIPTSGSKAVPNMGGRISTPGLPIAQVNGSQAVSPGVISAKPVSLSGNYLPGSPTVFQERMPSSPHSHALRSGLPLELKHEASPQSELEGIQMAMNSPIMVTQRSFPSHSQSPSTTARSRRARDSLPVYNLKQLTYADARVAHT